MDPCLLIAMQCVKMNLHAADFHAGAGDESAKRRDNVSTRMLIERLQYEHALGQDGGQHYDGHFTPIAGVKQLSGGLSVLFVVLYQVPNDQIGIDKLSLAAHRMPSRSRAAFAAASRIWAKASPLPFLLASTPRSDRVPGCTRMVAWSPFTIYSSLSPGLICSALRISPGIVVCPLLVTVECDIATSFRFIFYLLYDSAL